MKSWPGPGTSSPVAGIVPDLPFPCSLELHARFSATDILAAFDRATLASAGQKGTGVLHFKDIKAYALLITFQKTEKEFSPTTMYADYPISRSLLHWESQSNTALDSPTGQNLVHHTARGYTILVFARDRKDTTTAQCRLNFWGRSTMSAMRVKGPSRWCGSCGIPCRWRCLRRTNGAGDGNPASPVEII
ncbi:MAG: DUF3427 domain-containing protein [Desulfotignum sp.]|nr:DUF3427 domain-containing protein [Desulfotignum sp.]